MQKGTFCFFQLGVLDCPKQRAGRFSPHGTLSNVIIMQLYKSLDFVQLTALEYYYIFVAKKIM